ncbi:hypothetical protein HN51_036114 [Arachis hypogaea]
MSALETRCSRSIPVGGSVGITRSFLRADASCWAQAPRLFALSRSITGVLFAAAYLFLISLTNVVQNLFDHPSSTEIPWKQVDGMIWLDQAITQLILAVLIIHEKRFQAVTHPFTLRVYWIVHFIITCLFVASGIIRLVSVDVDGTKEFIFKVDDIVKSTFGLF